MGTTAAITKQQNDVYRAAKTHLSIEKDTHPFSYPVAQSQYEMTGQVASECPRSLTDNVRSRSSILKPFHNLWNFESLFTSRRREIAAVIVFFTLPVHLIIRHHYFIHWYLWDRKKIPSESLYILKSSSSGVVISYCCSILVKELFIK